MSLGTLCLSIYLILIGCIQLFGLDVSATLLGLLALIAGILILVDAWHPLAWPGRRPQ
jgi:hypothetical protein